MKRNFVTNFKNICLRKLMLTFSLTELFELALIYEKAEQRVCQLIAPKFSFGEDPLLIL